METKIYPPTPEQAVILEFAQNQPDTSLMISAGAGCGKTDTLVRLTKVLPKKPSLAVAFNVKIKKELESRFPDHFEVKTLNGLGHTAWGRAIGKNLFIDGNKTSRLLKEVIDEYGLRSRQSAWDELKSLVHHAQINGLVPSEWPQFPGLINDTPNTWNELAEELYMDSLPEEVLIAARTMLVRSCKEAWTGKINFDDQIYMSAMFNGQFPRYSIVLVDEAQDLSTLNQIQIKKSSIGRLIVVGDPRQAIYGFRGADSDSMNNLRKLRSDWVDLPLTTTFRCPTLVVSRQWKHFPEYTADKNNPNGTVYSLPRQNSGTENKLYWGIGDLEAAAKAISPNAKIAVLCRNNAPLLSFAFQCIRQGVSVGMLGRDIGKNLVTLSKKILPQNEIPVAECIRIVRDWMATEMEKAEAAGQEGKITGIEDRAECLLAVLEAAGVKNAGEMRQRLDDLFACDIGRIVLASGHRAKGLEWEVVCHLDPWRVPSRQAKKQENKGNFTPMRQERNLQYVIETRTRHTLIFANLENFE